MLLRRVLFSIVAIIGFSTASYAQEDGGTGLHTQPWIIDSFLEFSDDLAEAAAEGKDLLVLVEQDGCPYCAELHAVNFERDEIVDYIKEHFVVIQLDLFGARGTVDFDGEEMEERDLVFKWGAQFTPTTIIFSAEKTDAESYRDAEVFRLPGYLKPFHYMSSLEYVGEKIYKEMSFQRYLQAKFAELAEQGITPDVW